MKRLSLTALCFGVLAASPALAQGIQTGNTATGTSLGAAAAEVVDTVTTAVTDAASAVRNPDSQKRCVPACYDTADAKPGCDVPQACQKIEKETGYFSNIDKTCQLPAGTAIKMADLESDCKPNVKNRFGYTGMFQFDTNSCKRGNLYDLNVQAACMCDYTANTRNQFKRQNGGQEPSAGMYYLFHQQGGGCATKLAFGGRQSAAAVVKQCARVSDRTALRRIACNLPGGCEQNMGRAANISAEEFANLYLSKFNGIDNTNICAGGSLGAIASGTTDGMTGIIQQQMASNPFLAAFVNAAGGPNLLANMIGNSGSLTGNGAPMNILDVLRILGMEDTSGVYDETAGKGYDTDEEDDTTVTKDEMTFAVTTNADGTKTVKVTHNATTRTHTVAAGMRMYACGTTIRVVKLDSADDTTLASTSGCTKITESVASEEPVVDDAVNDAAAAKEDGAR